MPLKCLMFTLHNYFTKRDYSYSIDDLSDLAIAVCVGVWIYTYFDWGSRESEDPELANTRQEKYAFFAIKFNVEGDFNLIPFLAAIVFFMWARFILMLQLTKTFGPMLRIIINMFADVFKFLFIWTVILFCMASVSSLLFGELDEYANFKHTIFIMFGTGLGEYDLEVFESLSLGPIVGEVYIVLAVIINCIVLLNFIIAILADTYSKLSS